ncbi:MAG: glycosyltransferase family 9 protein [Verrucomicrobia bacterium]|nr:glycosyltransferase family 9 protein [Verrucomicrobiota bacterium]
MRSIFVLKPSSLGDVVHTLPAVARLKAARPEARVSWLVNPEWAPVLQGNPDMTEIVEFPRRTFRGLAGWGRLRHWINSEIRGRRPELALDFQGLLRTALLGRLSGAVRLHGLADAREGAHWFYHRTVPLPRHADGSPPHAVERYLALVDDLLEARTDAAPVRFFLPEGEPWRDDAQAELPARFILLHPFARGEGKSLSQAQVLAICQALNPQPVLIVGKSSRENHAWPTAKFPSNTVNALDRTSLPQLLWLLRRASFVVSVDSGPMHLAAALTDQLVSLHAWTDPRRVGPFQPAACVWKSGQLWRMDELPQVAPALLTQPGRLDRDFTSADIARVCALASEATR